MGRLAGYSQRYAEVLREMREQQRKRQRAVAAATPFSHPPAGRRQMALLWFIGEELYGGMTVGRRGCPPLTDDMRVLLRKKLLVLKREPFYLTMRLPLCNRLELTPSGRTALADAKVTEADKAYIRRARDMWVLR
jgi:hypothetical protein